MRRGMECKMNRRAVVPSEERYVIIGMKIDGKLATEWLGRKAPNRRLSLARVHVHADNMFKGRWRYTHQGIAFDKEARVLDGQHRLHAVQIVSKRMPDFSITADVTVGLEEADRAVMDVHRPRKLADELTVRGIDNAATRAAYTRRLAALMYGSKKLVTDYECYVDWNMVFKSAEDWAVKTCLGHPKLKPAAVASPLMMVWMIHNKAALSIVEKVKGNAPTSKGDPGYALDQFLTKHVNQPKGVRSNLQYADFDGISRYVFACCYAEAHDKKRVPPPSRLATMGRDKEYYRDEIFKHVVGANNLDKVYMS